MSKLKLLILLLRNVCRAGVKVAVRQLRAEDEASLQSYKSGLKPFFMMLMNGDD